MKHIVDLSWVDGRVEAREKKSGDITTYHLKKDDKPDGSVVIWEYPVNDPPFGLYIAGCDPLTYKRGITEQKRWKSLINEENTVLSLLIAKGGKPV